MPETKRKTDAAPWRAGERDAADASVVTQLAALKRMTVVELKAKWESIFGTPAPNNSRSYLELRLSYRIQELTLGGPSRETRRTLDLLADEIEGRAQDDHRGFPQPGGRNPPRAGMGRGGAHRHGDEGRLRLAGAQVQGAVGGGAGGHRHAVERLSLLRPPLGADGRPMSRHQEVV